MIGSIKAFDFTDEIYTKFANQITALDESVKRSFENKINNGNHVLQMQLALLDSNNPAKLLKKTLCRAEKDGKIIKSTDDISVGEMFDLYLPDGHLKATVNEKTEGGLAF